MAKKAQREKSTLPGAPQVVRVPVDSTRVVALDLTPKQLRMMVDDPDAYAKQVYGALVWVRCRVPEGEAAPSVEDVRAYLKAAGARSARVDVAEVVARREKAEQSEVARLASARERMDWWLAKSLGAPGSPAADAVRAEVGRIMDAEGI